MGKRKFKNPYVKRKNNGDYHYIECQQNSLSKYISMRCPMAEWLEEPGSFDGHKIKKGGHRMVSGIVRAKVKEEIRKQLNNEDYGTEES